MSEFVKNRFPVNLVMEITTKKDGNLDHFRKSFSQKFLLEEAKSKINSNLAPSLIKQSLISSFKLTNNDIKHQTFNTLLSGTTLTSILIDKHTIYCANVGDSRAVVYIINKQSLIKSP